VVFSNPFYYFTSRKEQSKFKTKPVGWGYNLFLVSLFSYLPCLELNYSKRWDQTRYLGLRNEFISYIKVPHNKKQANYRQALKGQEQRIHEEIKTSKGKSILKGSNDGILHLKESRLWTLSIVQFFFNTTFQKLNLFQSSRKKEGLWSRNPTE
jgi:hypothetical protein